MRPALLVSALVFAACGAPPPGHPAERVFDPCQPLGLVVSAQDRGPVDQALAFWGAVYPSRVAVDPTGALRVRISDESPIFFGFYDEDALEIVINRALPDEERAVVIAHELGHALSLVHIEQSDRTSVMNRGNREVVPTPADAEALRSLWGTCGPD